MYIDCECDLKLFLLGVEARLGQIWYFVPLPKIYVLISIGIGTTLGWVIFLSGDVIRINIEDF